MNLRFVVGQLGFILGVLTAAIALVGAYETFHVWYDETGDWSAAKAMGVSVVIGGLLAGLCAWTGVKSESLMGRREALLMTATAWIGGSFVAALPFWLWAALGGAHSDPDGHEFSSFASCYFEAVSGLTTTGATVLGERGSIEKLPSGLLLWRSLTHWLGGLGIVVLFVAVLPNLGVGAKKLFQTESSAVESGVRPRIGETARLLWVLYLLLTILAFGVFMVAGMKPYHAANHAMSVMSTGGFSPRNASVGAYDSFTVDVAVIVFMLLAGVNFAVFYRLARGRWRSALRDIELRWYLILKLVVALVVSINIFGTWIQTTVPGKMIYADLAQALRFGTFQTAALHSGTGFGTANYDLWPQLSLSLLIGLMLIGGCAGSTAGGIKVIRAVICVKVIWASLERAFRPNVVRPIRLGDSVIDEDLKLASVGYVLLMFVLVLLGGMLVGFFESGSATSDRADLLTCLTASLSTVANVGPGMGSVGAVGHYGWFSVPSKLLLSLWMVLGRLEIFAVLVLLMPRFWRGD